MSGLGEVRLQADQRVGTGCCIPNPGRVREGGVYLPGQRQGDEALEDDCPPAVRIDAVYCCKRLIDNGYLVGGWQVSRQSGEYPHRDTRFLDLPREFENLVQERKV